MKIINVSNCPIVFKFPWLLAKFAHIDVNLHYEVSLITTNDRGRSTDVTNNERESIISI